MEEIIPSLGTTQEEILNQIWNEKILTLDYSIKSQPHLMSNEIYNKLIKEPRLGGLTYSFGPSKDVNFLYTVSVTCNEFSKVLNLS